jgi:GTP-binding protein HflX
LEKFRQTLKVRKERAILVAAVLPRHIGDNLVELTALAESAGAVVIAGIQQKIRKIHPATYLGKGKIIQLGQRVKRDKVDVVIFDNDLSPAQIHEIEDIVKVKVLDRSELILDIFATRAKTKQARFQVELAQLEYTYPRLMRMWSHLDTLAGAGGATIAGAVGGIGTRGPGEQQLEIDRRLVNKRITELKHQLSEIDERKLREIKGRQDFFKVCLVGYTNAGKSTLLNTLTGADVFVEDRLFATIDTRTRKWLLDRGLEILLSDTVGFVKNLPHQLVASFKATLEEAINADLLLHIVDAADEDALRQIDSVNHVLDEIGCGSKEVVVVLNKIDAVKDISQVELLQTVYPQAIAISAKKGMGLEDLKVAVRNKYKGVEVLLRVRSEQSNGRVQSFLRAHGDIIRENYLDSMVVIDVRLGRNQLRDLERIKPVEIEVMTE